MRILFVLSRVPYPLEKGDKLRAFHLIRELSQRHEITLFCLADTKVHPKAETELKRYCSEIYIHRIPFITKVWKLFQAFWTGLPYQVAYFYSRSAQSKFDAFLEEHVPQHIFCQLIRTAEYVKKYRTLPKTIDYMDAFSAGMEKMAKRATWPVSLIMQQEFRRLQRYEKQVAQHFDNHLIISEQDRDCLSLPVPLEVLPNGIDPQFFDSVTALKSRDLLFTGNMSYRPNVESARFLAQEVMPIVWKSNPSLRLCLAGATPASSVLALRSERIEVTGWVDDIREVYASSRVFVAPMLINSGLQNKLLEAMASELPCITTSLANNALGATPDQSILIADDAESTAEAILRLYTDSVLASRIAGEGKRYVTQTYSWTTEAMRLERMMKIGV